MSEKPSSIKLTVLMISVLFLSICLDSDAELNNNAPLGVSDSAHVSLQVASRESPTYQADKFPSLAEAIKAVGTEKAVLMLRLEQPIRANLRVPANITLQFFPRAFLNIASDVTVTIDGTLHAGLFQIFSGPGKVTLSSPSIQAYPQWWGGRGDGITDDTLAIQNAINSARNIYFSDGIFILGRFTPGDNYLENKLLLLRSNIVLHGNGNSSVLKLRDHLLDNPDDNAGNAHMISGYDLSNITIENLAFDMNGANNLSPPGKIRNAMALFFRGGDGFTIRGCFFKNCAGHNIIALGRNLSSQRNSGASIANNIFKNGGRYVGTPIENTNNKDFTFIYVEWDDCVIDNNLIQQEDFNIGMDNWSGGIEVHGNNFSVINNTIIGCDPAINIVSAPIPISKVKIKRNKMLNCLRGVSFFLHAGNVDNVEIIDNNIQLTQSNLRKHGICTGIEVPNGGSDTFNQDHANAGYIASLMISNNNITNIFLNGMRYQCSGMILHSLHRAKITHNTMRGLSDVGISFLGSPWGNENIEIDNNKIINCGNGAYLPMYKAGVYIKQDGYARIPGLPFYMKKININHNIIGYTIDNVSGYSGITIMNIASTKVDDFVIAHNTFVNVRNELFDGYKGISHIDMLNAGVKYLPQ